MCICDCGSVKSYRKPIANLRICGRGIECEFAVPSTDDNNNSNTLLWSTLQNVEKYRRISVFSLPEIPKSSSVIAVFIKVLIFCVCTTLTIVSKRLALFSIGTTTACCCVFRESLICYKMWCNLPKHLHYSETNKFFSTNGHRWFVWMLTVNRIPIRYYGAHCKMLKNI